MAIEDSTATDSIGLFRSRRAGAAQAFCVVVPWSRGRNSRGFGQAASSFGMGDARGGRAMTTIVIAITAIVVAAYPVVTNRLAGMIAAQPIATAITGRTTVVIRIAVTAALTTALTGATMATTFTAMTTTTTTTTTILRVGGVHDRQISRSNGAAASIRAQDITAMRLLFFKSMVASIGLISRTV